MSTITIPGVLVARVREGAHAMAGDIAEAIDHGEDLIVCRDRLTSLCALLAAISGDEAVEIDVSEHGPTLRAAVGHVLSVLATWIADMNDADPGKPGRQREYRLLSEFAETLRSLERGQ
jgi:hypothetical protein